MLSCTITNNCLNVKLLKCTNSYSSDLCTKYLNKYFTSNKSINDLLNLNVNMMDDFTRTNTKSYSLKQLEQLSSGNPLWLFSECFACDCGLNRGKNGVFRNFMEYQFNKLVTTKYSSYDNVTYSSYYPGYYFQDIVLLTNMGCTNKRTNITVNLVGITQGYVKFVSDLNVTTLSCAEDPDIDNDKQKYWFQVHTYRIIKLLEWFDGIGLHVNLNIYDGMDQFIDNCRLNYDLLSDITVGIDYVDESLLALYQFNIFALCTTRAGGHIVSLRTDGIPFVFTKLMYHFAMYVNYNPIKYINLWFTYNHDFKVLRDNIKGLCLEILDNKQKYFTDIFKRDSEIEAIEQDGKVYKHVGFSFSLEGTFVRYQTNDYEKLQKNIDILANEMYMVFDDDLKKCLCLYKVEGTNYAIGKMCFDYMYDSVMSWF